MMAQTDENWLCLNTPELKGHSIVEVTMEMAFSECMLKLLEKKLTPDEMRAVAMATSVGGIGPLLKERVIAQGDLGANVISVSLLYDKVWAQKIVDDPSHHDGRKKLVLEKVDIGKHLRDRWEIFKDTGEIDIRMYDGKMVTVKVLRSLPGIYGESTVYFLDVPEFTDTIGGRSNVVYPGDTDLALKKNEMRFNQSWILGRGTLTLLKKLNLKPDIVVISEAPAMFVHHKMFKDHFLKDSFFKGTKYIFNDHTPLEYAHPLWDRATLRKIRVNPHYYKNIPVWKDGTVDATVMIINASDGVYGVSRKHGKVMQAMPLLRQFAAKIAHITNGVSRLYWPQDDFGDLDEIGKLHNEELLVVKGKKRIELIRWLAERQSLGDAWKNKVISGNNPIGIWTRRIVGYKRLERFMDILGNDLMREEFLNTGIIMVIGGRIHQDDTYGLVQFNKLQNVYCCAPQLKERVIFLENYNIWEAPRLYQGADFTVMLADDGQEAAATGFQKAQMNGDIIIASEDGAVPESVTFYDGANAGAANGFNVSYNENGEPTTEGLLKAFVAFSEVFKDKVTLGKMIRNALTQTERVSVDRTAKDMLRYFAGITREHNEKKAVQKDGWIFKIKQMLKLTSS